MQAYTQMKTQGCVGSNPRG